MLRDAGRHVADRAQAQNQDAAALRDAGVLHRLPGRGQHVGQVHETVVRGPVGHLDRAEVRLRYAQVLGLPARHLAVQPGVAEQGGALALGPYLGRLALRGQPLYAHVAVTAGDVERDHHPVAEPQVRDRRADLLDDAHRFVPEDVALGHERAEHLVQVQVRAADAAGRHLDHRVVGILDGRIRHGVHADVPPAMPHHCLHVDSSVRRVPGPPTLRLYRQTAPPCRVRPVTVWRGFRRPGRRPRRVRRRRCSARGAGVRWTYRGGAGRRRPRTDTPSRRSTRPPGGSG